MTKTLAYAVVACLLLAAGITLPLAAQDRTSQPGQPTEGKMWIQNRGDGEAVPVSIQSMASQAPPLRVQVVDTPSAPALWEYRDIIIPTDQDPAPLLNAAGADRWETTGLAFPVQGGRLILMKRPR